MNYSAIKECDIANGEGVRTSLFVSGCRRHCPFCFNAEQQRFDAGEPFTSEVEQRIIESLEPAYIDGLSLLGGEPMEPENQAGLVEFVERVRERFPEKSIWCYTGDKYEDLLEGGPKHTEVTDRLLACIDILVDGEFINDLKDITLRFRGSSNQRIIDVDKTREAGQVVLWQDDPLYTTHTM
jgi:anaerobic ribonucleoside-triphosphate reductase activating protein